MDLPHLLCPLDPEHNEAAGPNMPSSYYKVPVYPGAEAPVTAIIAARNLTELLNNEPPQMHGQPEPTTQNATVS